MGQRITDEQVSEILEMGNAGMSASEASRELDISVPTITRIYREYNIQVGTVGRKSLLELLDSDDIDFVVEQYENTERPVREFLKEVGMSYGQLYTLLDKLGIQRRRFKPDRMSGREAQLTAAVTLYNEGMPIWQITDETGVHQPTLHRELHKRNVPLRYRKRGG